MSPHRKRKRGTSAGAARGQIKADLSEAGKPRRRTLLLVGAFLLAFVSAELTVVTVLDGEMGAAMWRGTGVEMFAGREAGIPLSLDGDAPAWFVAQVSATQDLGVVAIAYPGFLWLLSRFHGRNNLVMRRLRRVEESAAKHEHFVRRWGPLGVFLFMLVPFLLNGPLVGAVLGRSCGIATRWLILPVVAATAASAFAWTYFYDAIFGLVGDLHPAVAPTLTGVIVAGIVAWGLASEIREGRKAHKSSKA